MALVVSPCFHSAFRLGLQSPRTRNYTEDLRSSVANGGSVFFVGNSFFQWEDHNLPEWVAALGKARGLPFEVGGDIIPGDLILTDFLQHPVIKKALAERKYQIWVIQGHELEPIDHPREFRQAIRDFNKAIVAAGGSTVLFMTWEFRWRKILPEVADAYESIGQELHIPIIPAGLVYRDCDRAPPEGKKPFFLVKRHPELTPWRHQLLTPDGC